MEILLNWAVVEQPKTCVTEKNLGGNLPPKNFLIRTVGTFP